MRPFTDGASTISVLTIEWWPSSVLNLEARVCLTQRSRRGQGRVPVACGVKEEEEEEEYGRC
jgi:hypothetical protein